MRGNNILNSLAALSELNASRDREELRRRYFRKVGYEEGIKLLAFELPKILDPEGYWRPLLDAYKGDVRSADSEVKSERNHVDADSSE